MALNGKVANRMSSYVSTTRKRPNVKKQAKKTESRRTPSKKAVKTTRKPRNKPKIEPTSLSIRMAIANAAGWAWNRKLNYALDSEHVQRLDNILPISWDDAITAFEYIGGHQFSFDYRRTKQSILVYVCDEGHDHSYAISDGCTGESLCRAVLKALEKRKSTNRK